MFFTIPVMTLPSVRLARVSFFFSVFSSSIRTFRDNTDVAAFLVDLDHPHPELLPLERVEVANGTNIDLGAREEGAYADIDSQTALDPLDHVPDHDLAVGIRLLDLVPDLHLLRFFAGQTIWPFRSSVRSSNTSTVSPD